MLEIDPDKVSDNYVSYALHDSAGGLQYIGICKLKLLVTTPDARSNPLFDSVFPAGSKMIIRPLFYSKNKWECHNFIGEYLKINPRPFMMKYGVRLNSQKPIECVETGHVFRNLTEAARILGVPQPRISNHLRQHPGYENINGRHYKWAVAFKKDNRIS